MTLVYRVWTWEGVIDRRQSGVGSLELGVGARELTSESGETGRYRQSGTGEFVLMVGRRELGKGVKGGLVTWEYDLSARL